MAKTIAVTGATGVQGGAVARVLLKAGWNVRAMTRNPDGKAAQDLKSQGAEVVSASFDDESTLAKAFEGAQAIFAVTNYWEHLFTGKDQEESGVLEQKQATTLARIAAKVSGLEHYIWSTLPSGAKMSGGKHPVPHLDYKAEVDEYIRKELPDLAKKTTYLVVGYYPSNVAYFPPQRPIEVPGTSGTHIWLQPTQATARVVIAGDMTVTPGIWVKAILERPSVSLGNYAMLVTETLSYTELLQMWSEVTGKRATFVECSADTYVELWGVAGDELVRQFKWGEGVTDWSTFAPEPQVSMEQLGISAEGIDTKAAFESLKSAGLL